MIPVCSFIKSFVFSFLLLNSVLHAYVVSQHGARVLALSEGGRSFVQGVDSLRINPAGGAFVESGQFGGFMNVGLSNMTLAACFLGDTGLSLQFALVDLQSDFTVDASHYFLGYSKRLSEWLAVGANLGYNSSVLYGGLEYDLGMSIGPGIEKNRSGFIASLVFRNMMDRSGFKEVSFGTGYDFNELFKISIDNIAVFEPLSVIFDMVFALEFIYEENHIFEFSARVEDLSNNTDMSLGFGYGWQFDNHRFNFSVSGKGINTFIYGFSYVNGL